jgi:hypothetical protein
MKRTAQTVIAALVLTAGIATGATALPAHAAKTAGMHTLAVRTHPTASSSVSWCYDFYWGWYQCSNY